ncbi:hypothetical protein T09_13580 [Trichinella sp. T9]|nr:hypothetical protein T09_13580 [Trichinella sp. T9]
MGWSHWGSIIFAFGPTVHLLVVVFAILLDPGGKFSVTVGACLSGQPDRPRAAPHPPAPGTPTASSPPSPRAGLTILAEMTLGGPI